MVKLVRFYIFGYRDAYDWKAYGPIVRDLSICNQLKNYNWVDQIYYFNRPVSIYERAYLKCKSAELDIEKVEFLNSFSFDLVGPLKRRGWLSDCYKKEICRY